MLNRASSSKNETLDRRDDSRRNPCIVQRAILIGLVLREVLAKRHWSLQWHPVQYQQQEQNRKVDKRREDQPSGVDRRSRPGERDPATQHADPQRQRAQQIA